MRSFAFLSLFLVGFFVSQRPLAAAGSNTVFVVIEEYYVTDNLDLGRFNPKLFRDLESLNRPTFVIKVGWDAYRQMAGIVSAGYNADTRLGPNQTMVFVFDDVLGAITADGKDGLTLFVLSP